jgi:predicted DNA-binding transcriptional regulator AlpA
MCPDTTDSDKALKAAKKAARKAARQARVRETLQQFATMPNEAGVRLPVVCALTGNSPATVWRHVRLGILPAPRKLSVKVTTWVVGDLREALKNPHPANTIDPAQHARNAAMVKRAAAAAG